MAFQSHLCCPRTSTHVVRILSVVVGRPTLYEFSESESVGR